MAGANGTDVFWEGRTLASLRPDLVRSMKPEHGPGIRRRFTTDPRGGWWVWWKLFDRWRPFKYSDGWSRQFPFPPLKSKLPSGPRPNTVASVSRYPVFHHRRETYPPLPSPTTRSGKSRPDDIGASHRRDSTASGRFRKRRESPAGIATRQYHSGGFARRNRPPGVAHVHRPQTGRKSAQLEWHFLSAQRLSVMGDRRGASRS